MTPLTAGLLTGLIVAAGTLLTLRGLTTTHPHLTAAVTRLSGDPGQSRGADPADTGGWRDRLGATTERALAGRRGFTAPTTDLQLLGRSTRWYWAQKSSSALAGFVIPVALTLLNAAVGSPLPVAAPLLASVAGAVYFWFYPDTQVKTQAAAARADFARAAVTYLQLMTIHRSAGDVPMAAMRGAAEVSDIWMFVRIREELSRATLAGVSAWDGMTQLGDRTGIPELREVGDIMRLAGDSGAGVNTSLLARARGMRDKILAAEHQRALDATNLMNLPIILLVTLLFVAAALPAVVALLTATGGL